MKRNEGYEGGQFVLPSYIQTDFLTFIPFIPFTFFIQK